MPVPDDDRIILPRLRIDPILGVHGDWAAAFGANIVGPLLIAAVVVLAAVVVGRRIRHRPPPALEAIARHRVTYAVLGVWLVYAVVRLIGEI